MTQVTGATRAELVLHTDGAEATRAVAAAVAGLCGPGDVVLLAGDLGAGKTTFAQGFGRALGIDEPVTSPTFTLVRQYAVAPVAQGDGEAGEEPVTTLLHADVYRLDHLAEIVDLGLGELVEDGGVALVEWGDVAEPVLGRGALVVRLVAGSTDEDEDDRTITVTTAAVPDARPGRGPTRERATDGGGPAGWEGRWPALAAALQPWVAA